MFISVENHLKQAVIFHYAAAKCGIILEWRCNLETKTRRSISASRSQNYILPHGIKQSDLAKKAHISQSSLSKIENGHYDSAVSLDVLLDLAEILNIDFTLFLTFNETEQRQWYTELPPQ